MRLSMMVVVAALSANAVNESPYTFFCRYACGQGNFTSSCIKGGCSPPPKGCSLLGIQAFHDDMVCSEYLRSGPTCNGVTQQCDDAADFQLVYDRNNDIQRTYQAQDWAGVAKTFLADGVVFAPGGTHFVMGRKDIAAAIEAFHDSGGSEEVKNAVSQVLTVEGPGALGTRVHATGTWGPATGNVSSQVEYYARWVEKSQEHWVMDTLLIALPPKAGQKQVGSRGDPIFDAIKARQARFASLYDAKNYTALVSELYADHAAVVPAGGKKPVATGKAGDFFSGSPLGDKAKVYPTIVTKAADNQTVHEIGFSDSTDSGYYARWIWSSKSKDWMMESHCFAVFPKVHPAAGFELVV